MTPVGSRMRMSSSKPLVLPQFVKSVVGGNSTGGTTPTAFTLTIPAGVPAVGNFLFLWAPLCLFTSVTDTKSNTWTIATDQSSAWCFPTTPLVQGDQVTTAFGAHQWVADILEFSGVANPAVVEAQNGAVQTNSTNWLTPTITITSPNALVLAHWRSASPGLPATSRTPGTGFSAEIAARNSSGGTVEGGTIIRRNIIGAGSVQGQMTVNPSRQGTQHIIAFKPA